MDADAVAELVERRYGQLPKTGKPQPGEWTVLAGVVLSRPGAAPEVVALGTGTKCLTAAQIAADSEGACVHDTHAEVCARRALLAYLLSELGRIATSPSADTPVLRRRADGAGFELQPEVALHLYTSEPPCGDAAIFGEGACARPAAADESGPLAKRPRTDCGEPSEPSSSSSPPPADAPAEHRTGARPAAPSAMAAEAASGGTECALGLARTKPGRGERTCCMSCSDKLARWGALGVQGALLSLLLPAPIRFATVSVGQPCSLEALRRALSRGAPAGPDADAMPRLASTSVAFAHGQPRAADPSPPLRPCSNALLWSPCGLSEALNGLSGKRLGANKRAPSPKHRSSVCKALLLRDFLQVLAALPSHLRPTQLAPLLDDAGGDPPATTYAQAKRLAVGYVERKAALLGRPPFDVWIAAPSSCEAFCCRREKGS